jgi:hypothetical protein
VLVEACRVGKTALIERFLAEPGIDRAPAVLRAGGDEAGTLLASASSSSCALGGLDPTP